MTIAPWQFTRVPSNRRAEVVLVAFSTGPLGEDVPLLRERFGIPGSVAFDRYDVRSIARVTEPGWFDAWRTGSLRAIAERDLEEDLEVLDAADHVHMISIAVESPPDLGYLQAAWGLARYLGARGARVILDAHAMTFTRTEELPGADAPLDVAREVRRVYETSSARPDQAHALHTRGMRKFGAPDLIALCSDADARLVGHALGELADAVARGTELLGARHALEVAPGIVWYAVADEHHLGELLQVNNEARVIVDERGHDLVGVLERIPRGQG